MTTYYVKPDGDNGLDGLSEVNAWATITYALTQMVAYDTLNIAAGAYPENVDISTEHITLAGAGSGLVTVNDLCLNVSYPDVSGLTTRSASICPDATNVILTDVIATTGSHLSCVDDAVIDNCDFTVLYLPYQANAATFTNNTIRSSGTDCLYFGAFVGANTTFENTTILGTPPAGGGIAIANGVNTIFTDTTFEYPENAIKVSAGKTATFIQTNNKTFIGTTGTNTITATESTLVATEGTYAYRDFTITPDASITVPETTLWETSGDQNKTWKVEATGSRTITFQLGDMLANTKYDLKVGGAKVSEATSDASGVITFPAYTGSFSEKTFTTEKGAEVEFVPRVMFF